LERLMQEVIVMKNQEIAQLFNDIAQLLELKGENVFRVLAYQRAGQTIDGLPTDVATLSDEELIALPGIGPKKAKQFFEKLQIAGIDDLEAAIKEGRLRKLPGIQDRTEQNLLKGIDLARRFRERTKVSS